MICLISRCGFSTVLWLGSCVIFITIGRTVVVVSGFFAGFVFAWKVGSFGFRLWFEVFVFLGVEVWGFLVGDIGVVFIRLEVLVSV